jgi:transposase-like protein
MFRANHVPTSSRREPAAVSTAPRCPACGRASAVSKDKVPDANSYWRCTSCQEIWSPERLVARAGWSR